MSEERELERHLKLLEQINNANTIEELPGISLPSISQYLAQNVYFDKVHISQTLFNPVLDLVVKHNTFINKEVKKAFVKVLKENYPDRKEEDYLEKYRQIASSPRIPNILIEVSEKNKKLQIFQDKQDLINHEKTLKEIKEAYEIRDLPKVGLSELNTKIQRAFNNNDFIKDIRVSSLKNITDAYLEELDDKAIEQLVIEFCHKLELSDEQKTLMSNQVYQSLLIDKSIRYTVEEINAKEERKLKIYQFDHEETMQKIKEATRISQLPQNATSSVLTGYLSSNSVIFKNGDRISNQDLKDLTDLLLSGKKWEDQEVITELQNLCIKYYGDRAEIAYKMLYDKFTKLPKTYYLVEEINKREARQTEFIGKNCSNVNVYFIHNPKSPIEGGRFYTCYTNRNVNNLNLEELLPLNLEQIIPTGMDIDSVEWYVQEHYDKTFKAAGGIILNNDETIGKVNVFRPNDGNVVITKEEKSKFDELKELSEKVKEIIQGKKEKTEDYTKNYAKMQEQIFKMQEQLLKMQEQFITSQKETDKELALLEAQIDLLTRNVDEPVLGTGGRGGRA